MSMLKSASPSNASPAAFVMEQQPKLLSLLMILGAFACIGDDWDCTVSSYTLVLEIYIKYKMVDVAGHEVRSALKH